MRRRVAIATRIAVTAGILGACQAAAPLDPPQPGSGVVDLPLPDGGVQRVLYRQPEHPVAALVLLTGNEGRVLIDGSGRIVYGGGSFLVRTREAWLAHGFAIAVLHSSTPLWTVRSTERYADVLRRVVAYMRSQSDAPVWLGGQSMGSVAATNAAAHLTHGEIAGLLLTSAVTLINKNVTETVFTAGLGRVTVPTLVVGHVDDDCVVTPASGVAAIRRGLTHARKVEVLMIEGGAPPRSEACMGLSPHGYLGVEARTVDRIVERIVVLQTAAAQDD